MPLNHVEDTMLVTLSPNQQRITEVSEPLNWTAVGISLHEITSLNGCALDLYVAVVTLHQRTEHFRIISIGEKRLIACSYVAKSRSKTGYINLRGLRFYYKWPDCAHEVSSLLRRTIDRNNAL